jgi:hypothetical protein
VCRNIRTLYNFEPPATADEVRDAALQYVRKISGFSRPSLANQEVFDHAVSEVAGVSTRLLNDLRTSASPRNRELEVAKLRLRRANQRPR